MADYDIVLYGATGFTGTLAAEQLAGAKLRWAVAGRNRGRLEELAKRHGASGVIVADSGDEQSIRDMVGSARVIATTVGPYRKYGTPIVEACAQLGVHYADITGETPWVRDMMDRYHEAAVASGAKIVPFCGFDSVPADLGTLMIASALAERGESLRRLSASYSVKGGLNGGTLATMLTSAEVGDSKRVAEPFILCDEPVPNDVAKASIDRRSVDWDEQRSAWLTPFVMAPINTRVVRRSAELSRTLGPAYGDHFIYTEAMETSKRHKAALLAWAFAAIVGLSNKAVGRKLLAALGPSPGQGPSQKSIIGGRFRVRFVGESSANRAVSAVWEFPGDPGNRFTVSALCAAATMLAGDVDELPGGSARAGFLTPAMGLGLGLVERLELVGLQASVSV